MKNLTIMGKVNFALGIIFFIMGIFLFITKSNQIQIPISFVGIGIALFIASFLEKNKKD